MPIEINELIVRATVDRDGGFSDLESSPLLDVNKLKEEVLEACRELIRSELDCQEER